MNQTDVAVQWHPAFSAAMRIELEAYKNVLEFEDEHLLSKKPLQIDVLVIKKDKNVFIETSIGNIFQKHNIIEYKSPEDYFSINDFYKVNGYACLYLAEAEHVDEIKAEEITITFVGSRYPRQMIKKLKERHGIKVVRKENGIYYLYGGLFAMQLIVTKQLKKDMLYWLQILTNDLRDKDEIQTLVKRYEKNKNSQLYQTVMDAITRANWEQMEGYKMCDALRELFADEFKEYARKGWEDGEKRGREVGEKRGREKGEKIGKEIGKEMMLIHQVCIKLKKGKFLEQISEELEETYSVIEGIMKKIEEFAPDYDEEKIIKSLFGHTDEK